MKGRKGRMSTLAATLLIGTLVAAGCEDDPVQVDPPTMAEVAGEYTAAGEVGAFTTDNGEVTDLLDAGAEVTLTLDEDGTLAGSLLIPGAGEGGADLEVDFAGSWTLNDFVVTVDIDEDTFMDGAELTWASGTLSASGDYDTDVTFDLELARE
jgi:hypothetical protein